MADSRVALVVGASSGMGRATARAYADAGMRVALAARSEDELNVLAAEMGEGRWRVRAMSPSLRRLTRRSIGRSADSTLSTSWFMRLGQTSPTGAWRF